MTVELHGEVHGAQARGGRSPLVILHGLFGSSTNWRGVAKQLSGGRVVHVLDLRNHGVSPHTDDMNYAAMAGDVHRYMMASELAGAVIIGHSMGGKTAMHLALHEPDVVSRLIVVDIAPVPRDREFVPLLDALQSLPLHETTRRTDLDSQLSEHVPEAPLRAFLLQNLVREATGFKWRLNLEAIRRNLPALLDFETDIDTACYEGATMFVLGENSDYVLPEHHAATFRLFPQAHLASIANAGHWVHAEQPRRFIEQVQQFLAA